MLIQRQQSTPTTPAVPRPRSVAASLLLLLFSCFLWASLLTRQANDWPNPNVYPHAHPAGNACGPAGAWMAHYTAYYLGDGVYPLLLFTTLAAITSLSRGTVGQPWQRGFGVALLVVATSTSVAMISTPGAQGLPEGPGGILGMGLAKLLFERFSGLGAALVLGYLLIMGLAFAAQGWTARLPSFLAKAGRRSTELLSPKPIPSLVMLGPARIPLDTVLEDPEIELPRVGSNPPADKPAIPSSDHQNGRSQEEQTLFPDISAEKPVSKKPRIRLPFSRLRPDPKALTAPKVERKPEGKDPQRSTGDWIFPSLTLLDDPVVTLPADHESVVRTKAKVLERTLEDFRLNAQVVQIDTGPVITMYELQLAAGIKVSQIASLSNDIARALKAPSVRLVAPIPGKNTVGIEVPNVHKQMVRLKQLLIDKRGADMALPLFLGQDASGKSLVADLAEMPHLLIAGTTGSGKSVCINSILGGFLMTQRPDDLKLILVDPKMVELSRFKDIPHLMSPIVTDVRRAEVVLDWAVTKMEERYALLSEARVRNIAEFNDLGEKEVLLRFNPMSPEERERVPTHLPYIVIVIDELADLMMTSAKLVEHQLCRLAQKSRAVGIHIIMATQRPEAKVVTGLIKSNMPCRIAFRVASRIDSRIVLDQNGADMLMGRGDMLFLSPSNAKLIRAQGTYLSDDELQAILDDLKTKASPQYQPDLVRMKLSDDATPGERDPMFDEAVKRVLESGRGSVSMIQHRLGIGYVRASRLIEEMTDAGILGVYKGSQARDLQMTLEEWERLRRSSNSVDGAILNNEPTE